MATLSFAEARRMVFEKVPLSDSRSTEIVWLNEAMGRVLAEDVPADRDMPPLPRSLRDGFAVRGADLPGPLEIVGEVKAGQMPDRAVSPGQALAIMTGAVIPEGADRVVMKEHTKRDGDRLYVDRETTPREWISEAGSMARQGDPVIARGLCIDSSAIAMLASVGRSQARVFSRPIVRILSTGDEVLDIARKPDATQVRNSNAWALAADVKQFGGSPEILPVAPDEESTTRDLIEYGLEADLLLISGGVSAGDYDFVETALARLGAEFYFDRVLIQPGQPTVFGQAKGKFFFGLPGNPLSTWVTFRLFAQPALERFSGLAQPRTFLERVPIAAPFKHKPGLTRFLPGHRDAIGPVEILPWQGSGDIPALVRANCIVVVDADRESWAAGEAIGVLPK
jgi:molybdopterin molybdotransferase